MSGFIEHYAFDEHPAGLTRTPHRSIAFEGRLDNRPELIRLLCPEDAAAHEIPDSALALKAYDRWGAEAPAHLLGDFAFTVWEPVHRRLFCARDALGVVPLYYVWNGRRIWCATTLQALLGASDVPRRVNESMLADYLLFSEFHDPGATFFEDIRQLPPAHSLTVEHGALRFSRYWTPGTAPAMAGGLEEHLERFRGLFVEAVRCRMDAALPTGVWLSGGIDSSLVTAAAESLGEQHPHLPALRAFTLYYEDLYQEEWAAVERLAAHYGTPVERLLPPDEPLHELFLSRSAIPYYHGLFTHPRLFDAVRRQSCEVLLTGHGGDELVGMSEEGLLTDCLRGGRWLAGLRAIRRMAWSANGSSRALALQVLRDQLPPGARLMARTALGRQMPAWLDREFGRRLGLAWRRPPGVPASRDMSRGLSAWALTRPSMTWSLNQLHETASAFGLECRHPFLDRRLIDGFLSVPREIKMKAVGRKLFAQRALAEAMPGPLRERLDGDSVVPFQHLDINSRRREAASITQALGSSTGTLFRYIRPAAIAPLCERLVRGDVSVRTPLWKFIGIARWLEAYLEPGTHRHAAASPPRPAAAPAS